MTHDDDDGRSYTLTLLAPVNVPACMDPTGRRRMDALVTPEAHDGWHQFAESRGVTVTALLEVLGRKLHDGDAGMLTEADIEAARALKAERSSRRRERRRPGD